MDYRPHNQQRGGYHHHNQQRGGYHQHHHNQHHHHHHNNQNQQQQPKEPFLVYQISVAKANPNMTARELYNLFTQQLGLFVINVVHQAKEQELPQGSPNQDVFRRKEEALQDALHGTPTERTLRFIAQYSTPQKEKEKEQQQQQHQGQGCRVRVLARASQLQNFHNYKFQGMFLHLKDEVQEWRQNIPRYLNVKKQSRSLDLNTLQLCTLSPGSKNDIIAYFDYSRDLSIEQKQTYKIDKVINFSKLADNSIGNEINISFDAMLNSQILQIDFSLEQCEKLEYSMDQSILILYFHLSNPCKFHAQTYDKTQFMNPKFNLQGLRIPNFGLENTDDPLLRNYLSQTTVLRLNVYIRNGQVRDLALDFLMAAMKKTKVEKINRDTYQIINLPQNRPPFYQYMFDQLKVDFEIKYSILAILSQGILSPYDVTKEITDLIVESAEKDQIVAERALKKLATEGKVYVGNSKGFLATLQETLAEKTKTKTQDDEEEKQLVKNNLIKTKRVVVTPTTYKYYVEQEDVSNAVLRKHPSLAKSHFIRFSLEDERGQKLTNMPFISELIFGRIVKVSNVVGRNYQFLGYSQTQLKESQCWIFCEENPEKVTIEKLTEEMGEFSDIKIPALRGAAMGQLLTASVPSIKLDGVKVDVIDDLVAEDKKVVLSEGVGKISLDLLKEIRAAIGVQTDFTSVQVRCGGFKGNLIADPALTKTIQFRKSMQTFEKSQINDTLDIVSYGQYRPAFLNRQIILLLLTLGIEEKVFEELYEEYIKELESAEFNEVQLAHNHPISQTSELLTNFKNNGIDFTEDAYVNGVYLASKTKALYNLKNRGNILLKEGASLVGVVDEYGVLEQGECFIVYSEQNDKKVIESDKVIATRTPCIHPGDIRFLKARKDEATTKAFAHLTNCVVFAGKGKHSSPSQMAGGDLDGDIYFVSWDKRIIPTMEYPPMEHEFKDHVQEEKEQLSLHDVADFFVEFICSDAQSKIETSHLAIADQNNIDLARNKACIALAQAHAQVVGFSKHGVNKKVLQGLKFTKQFPDYMEKSGAVAFESKTVIGKLYKDTLKRIEDKKFADLYANAREKLYEQAVKLNSRFVVTGYENHIVEAFKLLREYVDQVIPVIRQSGLQTEFELFSGNLLRGISRGVIPQNNDDAAKKLLSWALWFRQGLAKRYFGDSKVSDEKSSALYVAAYYSEQGGDDKVKAIVNEKCKDDYEYVAKKTKDLGIRLLGLPWILPSGAALCKVGKK